MRSFKDNEGQQWNLSLTLGKVRQLRLALGFDLLNTQDFYQVATSLTERMTFVFLLVKEQADAIKVDADAFEERLYGEGIADAASLAFMEETELFFQKLGQQGMASLARKTIEGTKEIQQYVASLTASGNKDSPTDQATEEAGEPLPQNDGNGSQS
jgi:hypothetical protein